MVLSPILLLNMLIAMMAKTYEDVIEKSKVEWKRQVGQGDLFLNSNGNRSDFGIAGRHPIIL